MTTPHDDPSRVSEREVPPVVIGCSHAERATADEAAVALRARGHEVQVLANVEVEDEPFAAAIVRHREGLYVLCRSASLPRQRIDKLRSILRDHGIPFARTLTLAIEAGQARILEERIVSVARRMVVGRSESMRPLAPAPPGTSTIQGTPAGGTDPRLDEAPSAAVDLDEIASWADSLAGPLPTSDEATVDSEAASPALTPSAAAIPDGMLAEPSPGAGSAWSGVEHTEVVRRAPMQTVPAPVVPADSHVPGISAFMPDDDSSEADLDAGAWTAGGRLGARRFGRRTIGLGVAAVVVLVVVVISVAKLSATPAASADDSNETKLARADDDVAPSGDASKSDDELDDEAGAEQDDAAVPDERAAEVPPTPAGDLEGIEERDAVPASEDSPQVLEALRKREVRALDAWLVASSVGKDGTFAEAVAFCSGLEVGGLSGWRVPTIGELWTIAGAKMMKPAAYWSDTVGDAHGDTRLVLNSKKTRILPTDANSKGARPVCIRERS